MVSQAAKITIEVDAQAAEILRQADERAQARGESLGAYLRRALPDTPHNVQSSRAAWNSFVEGMTAWTNSHVPPGHVADDSRDSIYDDRD